MGVEIVSTGGTAKFLAEQGVASTKAEEVTEFPEIFGGRVKTLHPKIFAGFSATRPIRRTPTDLPTRRSSRSISSSSISIPSSKPSRTGARGQAAIEKIDVGGPAMIRAAAKNHARVTVVVDPSDYESVLLAEIRGVGGTLAATRERLAAQAFARTAQYDVAISNYFARELSAGRGNSRRRFSLAFREAGGASLRREPAPAGRLYRDRASPGRRADRLRPAPGQGALVQQPPRRGLGRAAGPRHARKRGGDRQAQQPVRRWRSETRCSKRSGAPSRATPGGLRRNHRDPRHGRRRAGLAHPPALRRGDRRG